MSYSNYEQSVIIDGYKLLGVQSVYGNYGISEKPVRVAGVGFIDATIDSPLQGNFSINRKMVSTDPLLGTNSFGQEPYFAISALQFLSMSSYHPGITSDSHFIHQFI